MLEYLPELLKGLHTSLTLTVASIAVALVLALVFYHHPDAKNTVPWCGWCAAISHCLPVRRCWCKFS
ncbi:arginine transporter permease ArtM [Salmonella enterica subsp. arizonae]|uniref:Arginine transporter permease ArtM n=1 Tax=Salmonella enterica subsp. arizonae TaxID=59203 RepID=A0A2X4TFY7_SALER|nr:arginine transporter permease ArtM [Salmonella enterica subsp. arizonae]